MLKTLLTSLFLITFSLSTSTITAQQRNELQSSITVSCDPQLRPYLNKILRVPEARKLLEKIQKEGAISITVNNNRLSSQFGAFWDAERRIICINPSWHSSEGAMIGSILFELHNALATSQIDHTDYLASTGQIGKESYVRTIENIEFQNSHKAAKIAEIGIQMGLFPLNAKLPTYHSFEEHYHIQKIGGHSAWIARNFEMMVPRTNRLR